jgi:phage shock protein C
MTKRLTRSSDEKWIGGVCGGIAEYTDIDANIIRLVTAVAVILGFGTVFVAYIAAWILMPRADRLVTATPSGPPPPSE